GAFPSALLAALNFLHGSRECVPCFASSYISSRKEWSVGVLECWEIEKPITPILHLSIFRPHLVQMRSKLDSRTFGFASDDYAPNSTAVTNGRPLTTSRTPESSMVSRAPSEVPATIPLPSGVRHICMTPPFRPSTIFSQVAPLSRLRKMAAMAPSSRIHKFGRPLAHPK